MQAYPLATLMLTTNDRPRRRSILAVVVAMLTLFAVRFSVQYFIVCMPKKLCANDFRRVRWKVLWLIVECHPKTIAFDEAQISHTLFAVNSVRTP